MKLRFGAPGRGFVAAFLACVCATALPAFAQPRGKADKNGASAQPAAKEPAKDPAPKVTEKKSTKEKTFDFNGVNLNGQMRSPQLLYFLERANEELERASLEKRSFIPHMVRSVDEEAL